MRRAERRRWWRFEALIVLAGCASVSAVVPAVADARLKTGTWAGERTVLVVTDVGAHLEVDCASGEISTPLTVDDAGRLSARGVYAEQRGPEREGGPDRKPARFSGQLSGTTLAFDVILIDSNELVGHFTVVHGAPPPNVRKCR